MHYVYCITNAVNGKMYIGATSNVTRRWTSHKRNAAERNKKFALYDAMRLHGVNNFTVSVLACCRDKPDALVTEATIIKQNNTMDPDGYNMRVIGVPLPEEHAAKIRTALQRDDVKAKLSVAMKKVWLETDFRINRKSVKGRKHSIETKAKMSANMRGRKQSPEHLAKLSAVRKGRIITQEQKEKRSISVRATYADPAVRKRLAQTKLQYKLLRYHGILPPTSTL